jgi:hypothetical protein
MKKKFTFFIVFCLLLILIFAQNPKKVFYFFNNNFESFFNESSVELIKTFEGTSDSDDADQAASKKSSADYISGAAIEPDNAAKEGSDLNKTHKSAEETSKDFNDNSHKSNPTSQETDNIEVAAVNTLHLLKERLKALPAGTILKVKDRNTVLDNCFYFEDIKDDIKARIYGKSYKEDCTVPFESLKYVRVLYYGFDSETHIGELIVNKEIAADITDVFMELYHINYPIENMVLVDEYEADDNASMAANNTSAFNYRTVPGSSHLSNHALGLAIDINPLYNPYVTTKDDKITILPKEGTLYADRSLDCPYYIKKEDDCYKIFKEHGFTWGGSWKSSQDYQHFEKEIKK